MTYRRIYTLIHEREYMHFRLTASRCIFPAAATLSALILVPAAHAQTDLAYWNFNVTPPASEAESVLESQLFAVSGGVNSASAAMSTNFNTASTYTAGGTVGITALAGTTRNSVGSDAAGNAIAFQGFSSPTFNNNNSLFFSVDTIGYKNLMVSFAIDATSTGFSSDQLLYSTDNVTYTAATPGITPPASFSAASIVTFDLSGVSTLNNLATPAYFEIKFNGATGTSGDARVDNLQIIGSSAAPEPDSLILLAGVVLPLGGRLLRSQRRA